MSHITLIDRWMDGWIDRQYMTIQSSFLCCKRSQGPVRLIPGKRPFDTDTMPLRHPSRSGPGRLTLRSPRENHSSHTTALRKGRSALVPLSTATCFRVDGQHWARSLARLPASGSLSRSAGLVAQTPALPPRQERCREVPWPMSEPQDRGGRPQMGIGYIYLPNPWCASSKEVSSSLLNKLWFSWPINGGVVGTGRWSPGVFTKHPPERSPCPTGRSSTWMSPSHQTTHTRPSGDTHAWSAETC